MNKKKKNPNVKSATTKRKIVKTYELLRVDWEDHFSGNHHWVSDVKELNVTPYICVSVGVKVDENKKTLTLAQSMGTNEQMTDTMTILKNCIVDKIKLGELNYGEKT